MLLIWHLYGNDKLAGQDLEQKVYHVQKAQSGKGKRVTCSGETCATPTGTSCGHHASLA